MKFSEFPQEIKIKVKKRIQEQGGTYNEDKLDDNIERAGEFGFAWSDTPEEHEFWHDILIRENFDVFYKMYPKSTTRGLERFYKSPDEYPKSAKNGTKFKIVSLMSSNGDEDYLSRFDVRIGDILELNYNDGSDIPLFEFPDGQTKYVSWGCLAPMDYELQNSNGFNVHDVVEFVNLPNANIHSSKYRILDDDHPLFKYQKHGRIVIEGQNKGTILALDADGAIVRFATKSGYTALYFNFKHINKINNEQSNDVQTTTVPRSEGSGSTNAGISSRRGSSSIVIGHLEHQTCTKKCAATIVAG